MIILDNLYINQLFLIDLFTFILLYFLNPFIFATYTFNIDITSFTNSSSGSIKSLWFNIIIFPFEYLLINSSINSNPNLVNLSLYATTTSFIFHSIAKFIIFFIHLLFKFNPEPMSSINICFGYNFIITFFCLSKSSF